MCGVYPEQRVLIIILRAVEPVHRATALRFHGQRGFTRTVTVITQEQTDVQG